MGLPRQRTKWDRPGAGGLPHTLFLELGAWGVFLARTLQESLPSGLWDNCLLKERKFCSRGPESIFPSGTELRYQATLGFPRAEIPETTSH